MRSAWLTPAIVALALLLPRGAGAEPVLTRPPRVVRFVAAEYPAEARAAGRTATVILSLDVDALGAVTRVAVLGSAGPVFDAAASAAASAFVFEPAEIDGMPAAVTITYRYAFTLDEETPPPRPTVNLSGTVRERFGKAPLAGVRVRLTDVEGVATESDASGAFALADVPAGVHTVELSGPTLATVTTEEEVQAGKARVVTYFVELASADDVDEEVVVRAPRLKKEGADVAIRTEEARRVPGTQGDTLKVVQNLPGVARAAPGSGQLVVWGAAPRETHVLVDDVEVPALYHFGGWRSIVSSELVGGVSLLPGAYGAEYGRGLGGLVRVDLRPVPADGTHVRMGVDFLDAGALVTASPTPRLALALAGRASVLDRVLAGAVDPSLGDYFPLPRYRDAQLRATLRLRDGEELGVLGLVSSDVVDRRVVAADPAATLSERKTLGFWRVALSYTRLRPDGASVRVVPFVGVDRAATRDAFGEVPMEQSSDVFRWGVRASYRQRVGAPLTLSLGLDALGSHADAFRQGSLSLPAREGDVSVFGQPPGDDVAADTWSAAIVSVAPHAALEARVGPLTITPGLRLEADGLSVSRATPRVGSTPGIGAARLAWGVEPRLTVSWQVRPELRVTAAAGRYHQAPDVEDLSAVFGTPTLGLAAATHATAGAAWRVTGTLDLEVVGFWKWLEDLPVRAPSPTPLRAHALTEDGEGRSVGAQVLVRQQLVHGVFGWVSYAISRAERRRAGEPWRLFDADQTHALTAVVSGEWRGFTLGLRFRYATGAPRTPVVGASYDALHDRWQPIFGAQSSTRLPAFAALDVRLERRFSWPGLRLDLYADVQNVTNRSNAEDLVYGFDYASHAGLTGLPLMAVLGARVEF